jgi:tetratricopeptide (TPR) repeat protein
VGCAKAAWVLLIFGAVFAAYFPALGGKLVWDDDGHVTKPELRSLHGLERIWFEVGATQQYYPVLHSAFWVEHRLWGDATLGYHLVNLCLHATAACLLVVALRRLSSSEKQSERLEGSDERPGATARPYHRWIDGPLLAGLLFALHPVAVESVAWISEQKNTLSTVFYLLAALTYFHWRDLQPIEESVVKEESVGDEESVVEGGAARPYLYFIATGLFILAALSKSVTVSLPAALLVVIWWQRGRLSWRGDVVPLVPWFTFGAAAGVLTAWVEHRFIGAHGADFALSGIERCLLAGRIVWFYLGKLFWPADLIFIYPHWPMSAAAGAAYLYPLAVVGLLAAAWALRGRSRAPLAALLFFIGSLFPALGFFDVYPFRYSYVADHFQYLASLGIFALAAGGWACWRDSQPAAPEVPVGSRSVPEDTPGPRVSLRGWLSSLAAVGVLGLLGLLTWRQSRTYADIDTLYRATLARNPDSWLAHNNLANDLLAAGQWDEAIYHYQQAWRLDPTRPEAASNLGIALGRAGRSAEAVVPFEQALRLRPDYAEVHYNLGVALAALGRLPEAIDHYEAALQLSPSHAEIHTGLGMALARSGRIPEAVEQFEQVVAMQPGLAAAHYNLSVVLRAEGRTDAAAAEKAEAVRLQSAARVP